MTQAEKEARAAERRAQKESDAEERRARLEQLSAYDDEAGVEEPDDLAAWCAEYEARLRATRFVGRNAARDEAMLHTFLGLTREAGRYVFAASKSYLAAKSGRYAQSAANAIRSLRLEGYLKKFRPEEVAEGAAPTRQDLACRYALVLEALAPLSEDTQKAAKSTLTSLEAGDYSHDAYAGRKGFNSTRRRVWVALRGTATPLTATALAKEAGMNPKTVERGLTWLCENGFAERHPNPQAKRNEGDVYAALEPDEEDVALASVVEAHDLEGSTKRRVDAATTDWFTVQAKIVSDRRKRERTARLEERMRVRKGGTTSVSNGQNQPHK